MNHYDLSTTEDVILVSVTKIPTDSGLLAEIINLLCLYNVAADIISFPPVLQRGECITFTVSGLDIDKLLKVSAELKKYYDKIAFSISCANVKFTIGNVCANLTQFLFSKIITALRRNDIPLRFVSCSKREFVIITDALYTQQAKKLIELYL